MPRASRIVMLAASFLGCGSAFADESPALSDGQAVLKPHLRSDSFTAIDALEFHDNSAIGRLKRLREISFVTLSESRKSRLFLGINSEGYVGLHLRSR